MDQDIQDGQDRAARARRALTPLEYAKKDAQACPSGGRLLKRPVPAVSSSPSAGPAPGGTWSTVLPALWEFLSMPSWEDGSFRATGKLTIYTEGVKWKAVVKDEDGDLVAFLTAQDPDMLLLSIEEGLVAASLDWRKNKPLLGQGKAK